jgi:phosphate transport system permease protein
MSDLARIIAHRKRQDRLFSLLGMSCMGAAFAALAALLGKLIYDGASSISWEFLSTFPGYLPEESGILAPLVGSMLVMLVTAMLAVPLGIAAGVYMEEYGRKGRLNTIIEINMTNLAGVPSVVYGLLAVGVFIHTFHFDSSILVAGMTLGILILPIVIVATREALRTIPTHIREAAYALGATRWQVVRHHLLPYSVGGISTGVIIALSRAIGETAPLIVVGAVATILYLPDPPLTDTFPFVSFDWLDSSYTVMPLQMFQWTGESRVGFHKLAAAAGLVLIVITLSLNTIAIVIRYRARRRIKW